MHICISAVGLGLIKAPGAIRNTRKVSREHAGNDCLSSYSVVVSIRDCIVTACSAAAAPGNDSICRC